MKTTARFEHTALKVIIVDLPWRHGKGTCERVHACERRDVGNAEVQRKGSSMDVQLDSQEADSGMIPDLRWSTTGVELAKQGVAGGSSMSFSKAV